QSGVRPAALHGSPRGGVLPAVRRDAGAGRSALEMRPPGRAAAARSALLGLSPRTRASPRPRAPARARAKRPAHGERLRGEAAELRIPSDQPAPGRAAEPGPGARRPQAVRSEE